MALFGFRSPRGRRPAKKRAALSPLDTNRQSCDENGLALFRSRSSDLDDELWRFRDEIRQFRLSVDEHRESIHYMSDSIEQRKQTHLSMKGPERAVPFDRFRDELNGLKQETSSQIGSLTEQMSQTTRICEDRLGELVLRISRIESNLAELNSIRVCSSDDNEVQGDNSQRPESTSVQMFMGLTPSNEYFEKFDNYRETKKDSLTASSKPNEREPQQVRHCSGFISHWAAVSRFSSLSQ